jgi:uncharacterized protein YndB with AHSA1/START domain
MHAVERIFTSASPSTVWQILADVEHWPDWTPTVINITPVGEAGLQVGARYRVTQPKLRPAIYEVTECVPNERFTWAQKLPGGALVADHRIAKRDGQTEIELSFVSEGLLANIAAGLYAKMIREYVATEAWSLKAHCEALSR